jgi:hypothetical protein
VLAGITPPECLVVARQTSLFALQTQPAGLREIIDLMPDATRWHASQPIPNSLFSLPIAKLGRA